MKNFIIGVVVGACLVGAATAEPAISVWAGWSVKVNGETACRNPMVWPAMRQVRCP